MDTAIVLFRQDLRLADQPALAAAAAHERVIPLYVWAPGEAGAWAPGAASRWWLHRSLERLGESLEARGSRLILRDGPTAAAVRAVAAETGARVVYGNTRYEPAVAADAALRDALAGAGIALETFSGSVLHDPEGIRNQSGDPYQVFGAFWRAVSPRGVGKALAAPKALPPVPAALASAALASWALKPRVPWDRGLADAWTPGEAAAHDRLARFDASRYGDGRDLPAETATSRLSPHLHFGELSPRQVWLAARDETFLKELVWREFSYYLLHHHPRLPEAPLRREFEAFPWEDDPARLAAWQQGRTGFPIVDAGMRELWHTGWMHNRVRMIVASFLVKDLRVHWLAGARWFWDTLVDADLASNTQNWQWVAGCGADAAPYFRIFNPTLQGKKFDPAGAYVRRWVPEAGSPSYPPAIVDHGAARFAALKAFDRIKINKLKQARPVRS